jgi:predicted Rossmann fold nucleotide-binding protein DprA/Smf involved in DNA uptake
MGSKATVMDENKQAVLLMSAYFSAAKKGDPTPLTALEYGRFALWLKENDFQPQDLFHRFDDICKQWEDPKGKITIERLRFLLGRGMAMGLALEKWQSAGIWFISRSDPGYPSRLKKALGVGAPAILFGVGNRRLLNAGGLAIVGSRNIDDADRSYTATVAKQAAMEGLSVVSGGARGVDETAMLAALEVDGTALGILSNDLFKAAIASKWRRYIKSNQLVLTSPFYPEAPFQVGNAMGRNKYIYCLADYALAVRSEEGKGGTWSGAKENLGKAWVPMFVKAGSAASGNIALTQIGALPLTAPDQADESQADWLLVQLKGESAPKPDSIPDTKEAEQSDKKETNTAKAVPAEDEEDRKVEFQKFVELVLKQIDENGKVTLAELKKLRTDLRQKQLTDLLDRAVAEGVVERKGTKRTYVLNSEANEQLDIFS